MELKSGYKQSEVGIIPEDWEVEPLGGMADFITSGSRGWAQFYSESGALFIRSQNVRDGRLSFADIQYVSPPSGAEGNRTKVRSSDLLITVTGNSVGNVALVEQAYDEAYISQHVGLVRLKEPTSGAYICRYLSPGSPGNKQIASSQSGQSKPGLNLQNLKDFSIALPPTPCEQRAIATALSDVDGLLDGLDRLIAKKRDLKQSAMQQLLTGQTRLPGFQGEWKVKPLKKIVETPVTDGPHLTPNFLDDGIPFLSVNNLVANKIDLGDLRFISQQDHEVFSRKCKPQKGDVLLGKAASVGKVAIVELTSEFNIWSPIALIRVSDSHCARFVYYQLQSADLIGQITLFTNSSSQGNIGMGDIEKLSLRLPSYSEQSAIASVLTDMDAELAALEQHRDKTRALKQAMMQELLTGRTRLV
jgi:type I restriction enzyme S subunit